MITRYAVRPADGFGTLGDAFTSPLAPQLGTVRHRKNTMLIKRTIDLRSSEITDKRAYLSRREFLGAAAASTAAVATGMLGTEALVYAATPAPHGRKLENVKKSSLGADEKLNKWEEITTSNNFYEFGIDKDAPSMFARSLKPEPWSVAIDGECARRGSRPSRTSSRGKCSRSAFTATAAWRRGRW